MSQLARDLFALCQFGIVFRKPRLTERGVWRELRSVSFSEEAELLTESVYHLATISPPYFSTSGWRRGNIQFDAILSSSKGVTGA